LAENDFSTLKKDKGHWLKGWCGMCLSNDCGMLTRVENGIVVEAIGDPDCPTNLGKLCVRGGLAVIAGFYSPHRLKRPMKRTNLRKGPDIDPGWEEISWEEAFGLIATRLKKIRQEDPRKLVFMEGWGVCDDLFAREIWIKEPDGHAIYGSTFSVAAGTPNMVGTHGPLCPIHYASNLVHGQHPEQIADLQYCEYLIAPGRTVGPNSACPHSTKRFINAIERGMKLVVIDPRHSIEASKAYRWVPIRPGFELAFALAMVHTILYEIKRFDRWFIINRTNGPYLVGQDGLYLRCPETGIPVIWDAAEQEAKVFSDPIREPALEGEYLAFGQKARPGFALLKEAMACYTPEWAEKLSTVPAHIIREISTEFVEHARIGETVVIDGFEFPFRPAQFGGSGRGTCSHKNGMLFDLTGKIINMLVGAVEVPGGITGGTRPAPNPSILRPDEDGVVSPIVEAVGHPFKFPPDCIDGAEFFPNKHTTPHIMARNIIDPKRYHIEYEVEAIILAGANPLRSNCDKELFVQAFRKVPLVVSIAAQLDESTVLADVVLPNAHFLEKKGLRIYKPPLQSIDDELRGLEMVLGRQPVPRLYDTKSCDEILYELAERSGFLDRMNDTINKANRLSNENKLELERKYDLEEIWDHMIRDMFGPDYNYAYLMEHGHLHKYTVTGKMGYNYYYWPDNATRHPIYYERLRRQGLILRENLQKLGIKHPAFDNDDDFFRFYQGVPFWIANDESSAPSEYDLYVINWKTNFRIHGTGSNMENAWINEVRENDRYETYIHINSKTACLKGLHDGQLVWVESRYGRTKGRLRTTALIHPEVLGMPGNYGGLGGKSWMNPVMTDGPWFNALLTADEQKHVDPITGGIEMAPKVKVYPTETDNDD
jgi:anaerobic selenocysteine-containing dehydrogenase